MRQFSMMLRRLEEEVENLKRNSSEELDGLEERVARLEVTRRAESGEKDVEKEPRSYIYDLPDIDDRGEGEGKSLLPSYTRRYMDVAASWPDVAARAYEVKYGNFGSEHSGVAAEEESVSKYQDPETEDLPVIEKDVELKKVALAHDANSYRGFWWWPVDQLGREMGFLERDH